jgi:hypothetical protein
MIEPTRRTCWDSGVSLPKAIAVRTRLYYAAQDFTTRAQMGPEHETFAFD